MKQLGIMQYFFIKTRHAFLCCIILIYKRQKKGQRICVQSDVKVIKITNMFTLSDFATTTTEV